MALHFQALKRCEGCQRVKGIVGVMSEIDTQAGEVGQPGQWVCMLTGDWFVQRQLLKSRREQDAGRATETADCDTH
jgi:hypothetical protein